MSRFPKPWFRPNRNSWFVQIGGKQINLGKDKEAAFQRYHELMAADELPVIAKRDNPLIVAIIDEFLDWVKKHRADRTYAVYQERLQSFVDYLSENRLLDLRVEKFKPRHVQQWVDSHSKWNSCTKHGRMTSLKRVFNWAVKIGLIENSPIRHLEKPPTGRREKFFTPEQYALVIESAQEDFRDLLTVAFETGARPQELIRVEARHLDGDRWVFPAKESKGKKRMRIVYLSQKAREVSEQWAKRFPEGPMFRNSLGKPWSISATNCAFRRLARKLGFKIALVDFRHGFCTRSLANGVDPVTLAVLMGHSDTSMICRVYQHLSQETSHLHKALKRANGSEDASALEEELTT